MQIIHDTEYYKWWSHFTQAIQQHCGGPTQLQITTKLKLSQTNMSNNKITINIRKFNKINREVTTAKTDNARYSSINKVPYQFVITTEEMSWLGKYLALNTET